MTFTRTKSGLKNYKNFYNVEAIIYIEGRMRNSPDGSPVEDEKAFDTLFYKALFSLLSPFKSVRFKIVGNKNNVLDYHDKIQKNDTPYSYVIVDRDYDGILSSSITKNKIIHTYGYSWENDFWSENLCFDVLNTISLDPHYGRAIFSQKSVRTIKRLKFINKMNIIGRFFGLELFPISVKGGVRGFECNVNNKFPLKASEVKKIIKKFDKCHLSDPNYSTLQKKCTLDGPRLIQGHFYEYFMISLLSFAYKKSSGVNHNNIETSLIKNVAFNHFKLKPNYYLDPQAFKHYTNQFQKVLSA